MLANYLCCIITVPSEAVVIKNNRSVSRSLRWNCRK